jgi:hypothetical protein
LGWCNHIFPYKKCGVTYALVSNAHGPEPSSSKVSPPVLDPGELRSRRGHHSLHGVCRSLPYIPDLVPRESKTPQELCQDPRVGKAASSVRGAVKDPWQSTRLTHNS